MAIWCLVKALPHLVFFVSVGCPFGHFGSVCKESCNTHCLRKSDILCDHIGGECLNGCEDGYIGTHCNDCKKLKKKSLNILTCHFETNEYFFLKNIFLTIITFFFNNKACAEGYYGNRCSFNCSQNCETCRHTDGFCTCKDGWLGINCTTGKNRCNQNVYGIHQNYYFSSQIYKMYLLISDLQNLI